VRRRWCASAQRREQFARLQALDLLPIEAETVSGDSFYDPDLVEPGEQARPRSTVAWEAAIFAANHVLTLQPPTLNKGGDPP